MALSRSGTRFTQGPFPAVFADWVKGVTRYSTHEVRDILSCLAHLRRHTAPKFPPEALAHIVTSDVFRTVEGLYTSCLLYLGV